MVIVKLPDGSELKFDKEVTVYEVAQRIGEGLARAALAGKVNGELVDLNTTITSDSDVSIITFKDDEGKDIFRHSSSHVLALAVKRLFSDVKFGIGPSIEDGFYYDFDKVEPFTPQDLEKIQAEMKKIVKEDLEFLRRDISKKEAEQLFSDQEYKLELIKDLDKVSVYSLGEFVDLCKGPHVKSSCQIKAFKLTKIAGAYWKGDSSNKQLQRIYGISFPDKKELKSYLALLEEAEKRDHRKIGKQMELFSIHEEAPGMPFFHDKGSFIWNTLHEFVKDLMIKRDYEINKTPIILNKSLWLKSGHWDHYKENMYYTNIDNNEFAVKPMNCPGNIMVYKTKQHSYRELPIRAGEFGLVHRHELSGVLSGLFRVRCFTQDDAHVFCTKEQIKSEIKDLITFIDEVYSLFGFSYEIELSTKPEKAMGDQALWNLAENTLKEVLKESGKDHKLNEGDGAFYGPKIDFHLKDAIGRTWQCGTIQLDFQMPEKFDLSYEGKDGKKHRPVMLHRVILGSVERFMGILIEHYAGWFPLWINPLQARVIAVSDTFNDYARQVLDKLKKSGIRVDFDSSAETTGKKIRNSQLEKVPIVINIGEKEVNNKTVAVRTNYDGKVKFGLDLDNLIESIKKNIEDKEITFKV